MKYQLIHKYREEVFVPLLAIENNMAFLEEKEYPNIITSEGIECKINKFLFVNPLSEEGRDLIKYIYNIPLQDFLLKWYKNMPFDGLMFCWIKMEKI